MPEFPELGSVPPPTAKRDRPSPGGATRQGVLRAVLSRRAAGRSAAAAGEGIKNAKAKANPLLDLVEGCLEARRRTSSGTASNIDCAKTKPLTFDKC